MYSGQLVEIGSVADVYGSPSHPYTRLLLDAVPVPDPVRQRQRLAATPSEPRLVKGDDNAPCRFGEVHADTGTVPMHEVSPGHFVSCRYLAE
jgi:oligopeptide/dipeptide ABC transporter ATP-binding protein